MNKFIGKSYTYVFEELFVKQISTNLSGKIFSVKHAEKLKQRQFFIKLETGNYFLINENDLIIKTDEEY